MKRDDLPAIPLLDLKAQWRALRDELMPAIEAVCESQHFILGPNVAALEREVAAYCGSAHGIGTSSGTDALLLALMALGVGPGDAVLTTPYSFFATAGVVARLGARPVFCDVDADTLNLSPDAVRETIRRRCTTRDGGLAMRDGAGERVRVLLPVHLYGQCADLPALGAIAAEHGLALVEDAAQAIGAELAGGARAGSVGTIGCFSFFPSKNLGAFGDAGLCTTADPALAETMRVLRVHGGKPKYHHAVVGANLRLDELQAAILRVKLGHLDGWTAARGRNAARYDAAFRAAGLEGTVGLPVVRAGHRHVFNQYVIRSPRRDALREFLAERRIGTEVYYPVPLHLQACFAALGYAAGDCPAAEAAAAETVALPIHPDLDAAQVDAVVAAIGDFFG